jgi:hypothetical protein
VESSLRNRKLLLNIFLASLDKRFNIFGNDFLFSLEVSFLILELPSLTHYFTCFVEELIHSSSSSYRKQIWPEPDTKKLLISHREQRVSLIFTPVFAYKLFQKSLTTFTSRSKIRLDSTRPDTRLIFFNSTLIKHESTANKNCFVVFINVLLRCFSSPSCENSINFETYRF